MKKVRIHDNFYIKEDRTKEPLECFKDAYRYIFADEKLIDGKNLLDMGCASGDFLYYVSSNQKNINLWGADVLEVLLETAAKKVPNTTFRKCSIVDSSDIKKIKNEVKKGFDYIHLGGVYGIFDDLVWIDNILELLSINGKCVVFGLFNKDPFDAFVGIRRLGDNVIQSGWNGPLC